MPEATSTVAPVKLTRAEKYARFATTYQAMPPDTSTPEQREAEALKDEGFARYREKIAKIGYKPLDKTATPGV